MKTIHDQVREFMVKVPGQNIPSAPTQPPDEVVELRLSLIEEELQEYRLAVENLMSLVMAREEEFIYRWAEVADAIADLHYVVAGAGVAFGLPMNEVQEAVHRSNMAKFSGDAHTREDGKWIKPSDWTPPDIKSIIKKALIEKALHP